MWAGKHVLPSESDKLGMLIPLNAICEKCCFMGKKDISLLCRHVPSEGKKEKEKKNAKNRLKLAHKREFCKATLSSK